MEKGKMFRSAILAGIAIGIAGFGYLALGGIAGAVFFSFGLITVIRYKMKLYTGVVGFVQSWNEIPDTFLVLLGNIVGCLLVGLLARLSPMDLQGTAQHLLEGRLANGALRPLCPPGEMASAAAGHPALHPLRLPALHRGCLLLPDSPLFLSGCALAGSPGPVCLPGRGQLHRLQPVPPDHVGEISVLCNCIAGFS